MFSNLELYIFEVSDYQYINFIKMTEEKRNEITEISKEFAKGFKPDISSIAGSGWLIVDPLSAYLNAVGFENTLQQMPENEEYPIILIMTFKDGAKFCPAGSDLPVKGAKDWLWISGCNEC